MINSPVFFEREGCGRARVDPPRFFWGRGWVRALHTNKRAFCVLWISNSLSLSAQGEVHDSIEDARAALRLFELHRAILAAPDGPRLLAHTLERLYQ